MRNAVFAALAVLAMTTCKADGPHPFLAGGYQEAVFNVSDISAASAFYEEVAGWEVLHSGHVDAAVIAAYDLADGARGREVVLGNPGTTRGYLRLVEYAGIRQVQIRSNTQAWDTGGYFDVNARVVDMAKKFEQFQARGWQSSTDPVEFSFGPFVVKEWLARGHDGVVFALIERVAPALEGWPHLKELSRLFNATQIVTNADEALRFYLDVLGFEIYLEHHGASDKPGPNVLGLPHNLATQIKRHVYIVHPTGLNEGSLELLSFEGATGRDVSALAVPPNLGIATLRFEVSDAAALVSRLRSHGVQAEFDWTEVSLPPYGAVRLMAIRGPGGVWLEFYDRVDHSSGGQVGRQ